MEPYWIRAKFRLPYFANIALWTRMGTVQFFTKHTLASVCARKPYQRQDN